MKKAFVDQIVLWITGFIFFVILTFTIFLILFVVLKFYFKPYVFFYVVALCCCFMLFLMLFPKNGFFYFEKNVLRKVNYIKAVIYLDSFSCLRYKRRLKTPQVFPWCQPTVLLLWVIRN